MNMTADEFMKQAPHLVELARRSPVGFADIVRKRNTALIQRLLPLRHAIGSALDDVTVARVCTASSFGCPHCYSCTACCHCLWPAAAGISCMHAGFPTEHYGQVCISDFSNSVVQVCYSARAESIHVLYGHILDSDSFKMAREFLESHVLWTRIPGWGACAEEGS